MEEEVKAGIQRFQIECEARLPGVTIVIPTRPSQGNYLISLTYDGIRSYATISEDDFADWGETVSNFKILQRRLQEIISKAGFVLPK